MIRLHYSNRFDELIPPLAKMIAAQQRRAPLERAIVIVPNRVVEDYLKLRLSERLGVAANLEFPFLRAYLARLVSKADPSVSVLEINDLQILLFERLRAIISRSDPEFGPVRSYVLSGSGSQADCEVRTLELAGQTARIFREYSISRRAMLARWRIGTQFNDPVLAATERWQRALWQSIFDQNLAVRAELIAEPGPRRMILPDAFAALPETALANAIPRVLHVFGIGYAGFAFAEIFARIARLAELHVYALNPCAEFWEDLDIPGGARRERMVHRGIRIGPDLDTEDDPFGIGDVDDTPALRLWSRPGREYIRLLNELSDCDFDSHFVHRAAGSGASLLQRIQEDILLRAPERKPMDQGEGAPADASIRVLACPGIRREAEIIANEIWSMVRAQSGLHFHQIAVAVPDALWPDYQPHLETAFSQLHQIPVNFVNRRFASESRVAQAIAMLLKLPLGNLGRYAMLHLLTHPAIRGEDGAADAAKWGRWCEALGVFFGADTGDLKNTYLPGNLFHWDQALTRLALGAFMAGERSADAHFFDADGGADYLPMEMAQDEIAGGARMLRLARGLVADAVAIRSQRLTIPEWARLLTALVSTYVTCADPIDERVRDWCIEAIESIAAPAVKSGPVGYQAAYQLAIAKIEEAEGTRGRWSETGVAVGPLSALRSVPFRAIFLAGLDEARFPERPRLDPLDLRMARRKAGDVSPTERDRYAFLETILAARERLTLSYVARDAHTGESREPSTVVRELQFILRGYVDEKALDSLTVRHPVSRYDFRYFPEIAPEEIKEPLESFDPDARAGAKMAALRSDLQKHCGDFILPGRDHPVSESLSPDAFRTLAPRIPILQMPRGSAPPARADTTDIWLPISALRRFLECPIQGAAQYALRMESDDADALPEDQDEPVGQSALDRAMVLRAAFAQAGGDETRAIAAYEREFRVAQAHGRAPTGPFEAAENRADAQRLREWFAQAQQSGAGDLSDWVEVRIGRTGELALTDSVFDAVLLEVDNPSGGKLKVRLYGSAGLMSRDCARSIHGILRPKRKPKDFLSMIIPALALAAAGRSTGDFRAIVVGAAGSGREQVFRDFALPSAAQAHDYLASLTGELLFGRHDYFLPIEAVADVIEILRKRSKDADSKTANVNDQIEEALANLREIEWHRCSSDFGPVRNARRFAPPEPGEVIDIIERRFSPIKVIFT